MATLRPVPTADLRELRQDLEAALRDYNRAYESLNAAVIARAPCNAQLAAQAEARDQLFHANKRYREAVLAFLAKGADPATE